MVDISTAGFGFLQYSPRIALEPGTVLKGCCIELPGRASVTVDLEVRYSRMAKLPEGGWAIRSGCCFVNTPPAVIVKILTHLGLPARAPPRSPARRPELFSGGLIPEGKNGSATALTVAHGPRLRAWDQRASKSGNSGRFRGRIVIESGESSPETA